MTKKKKYGQESRPLASPAFMSACHPRAITDFADIVEDSIPSRVIAIVGRCHACMGVQPGFRTAENIDRSKLVKYLHGNSKWLIPEDETKKLRKNPDMPHGNLSGSAAPRPHQIVDEAPEGEPWDESGE